MGQTTDPVNPFKGNHQEMKKNKEHHEEEEEEGGDKDKDHEEDTLWKGNFQV